MDLSLSKLRSLELFAGYGGITLALEPWARPVAYCERDEYCIAQLISRMGDGRLPVAPICTDVTQLHAWDFPTRIDLISGGFPCQDLSCAGKGAGLAGQRSGLFYEIMRLAQECRPAFIFLENVPAIRTRGLRTVVGELADIGYDSRWCTVSAQQVGAPHKRERWFLLAADSDGLKLRDESRWGRREDRASSPLFGNHGAEKPLAHSDSAGCEWAHTPQTEKRSTNPIPSGSGDWVDAGEIPHSHCDGFSGETTPTSEEDSQRSWQDYWRSSASSFERYRWSTSSGIHRVANGLAFRLDRVKQCGNGVVPLQARTAFKYLSGVQDKITRGLKQWDLDNL